MQGPALPLSMLSPVATLYPRHSRAATIAVAISSLGTECASTRVLRTGPLLGLSRRHVPRLPPEAALRKKIHCGQQVLERQGRNVPAVHQLTVGPPTCENACRPRRQAPGGMPIYFLKARLKAASDS